MIAEGVLVVGYAMAVPFTVWVPGFRRLWKRREPGVFLIAQVGAGLITTGWLMKDNTGAAAFNAVWLLGLSVAYAREGRRLAVDP